MDAESEIVCQECGGTPCEWLEIGVDMVAQIRETFKGDEDNEGMYIRGTDGESVDSSTVRKAAYRLFTYMKFGHLGRGNRIPIPICVKQKIRDAYPLEDDSQYVGYYES